jgi:hypothetical protein
MDRNRIGVQCVLFLANGGRGGFRRGGAARRHRRVKIKFFIYFFYDFSKINVWMKILQN